MSTGRDVLGANHECTVYIFLLMLLLPCAASRFFSYSDSTDPGTPCVYLEVDFSVRITVRYHGQVIAERSLTARDGTSETGSCGQTERYIQLDFLPSAHLTFTFRTSPLSDTGSVEMSHELRFDPHYIFPYLESRRGSVCFKGPTKTVGNQLSSYNCSRQESSSYRRQNCDYRIPSLKSSEYDYSAEVRTKSIHVQAFNIQNKVFSRPVTCGGPKSHAVIIACSVVGAIVLVAILVAVFAVIVRRRKKQPDSPGNNTDEPDETSRLVGPNHDHARTNNTGPA